MDEALKIAVEKFKNLSFENIPVRSGASLIDNKIKINYLFQEYIIHLPSAEFSPPGKNAISKRDKIIVLHYLTSASGIPLTHRLIDFRDVPSGNMYYSVFEARVYQPFLNFFGKEPSVFIKVSQALKCEKIDFGNSAFKFNVLPRVPVNLILYEGDEDFPPACKVLFDSTISDYLPTEDIAIACEDLVRGLIQTQNKI